jgi:hypothetical protein
MPLTDDGEDAISDVHPDDPPWTSSVVVNGSRICLAQHLRVGNETVGGGCSSWRGAERIGVLHGAQRKGEVRRVRAALLLDSVAAALIGYAVLGAARPNAFGTAVGALFVGILLQGMTMMNAPYYTQDFVKGAVLVVALVFTFYLSSRSAAGGRK